MERLPDANNQRITIARWAIAYYLLSLAFFALGIVLLINSKPLLGVFSFLGTWSGLYYTNKLHDEYKRTKELENE